MISTKFAFTWKSSWGLMLSLRWLMISLLFLEPNNSFKSSSFSQVDFSCFILFTVASPSSAMLRLKRTSNCPRKGPIWDPRSNCGHVSSWDKLYVSHCSASRGLWEVRPGLQKKCNGACEHHIFRCGIHIKHLLLWLSHSVTHWHFQFLAQLRFHWQKSGGPFSVVALPKHLRLYSIRTY